jgi:hypothetical protein
MNVTLFTRIAWLGTVFLEPGTLIAQLVAQWTSTIQKSVVRIPIKATFSVFLITMQ